MSDELPLEEDPTLDDGSSWLDDEVDFGYDPEIGTGETDEAEHAAWLRGLPDDIRAEYLSRPWAGPLETEPAGYWHHDSDPALPRIGFAAGGALDTLLPGPELS